MSRRLLKLVAAGAALVLATLPVAFSAQAAPPLDIEDEDHIAKGRELFNSNCTLYCHGRDGSVKRSPSLRNREDLDERILYSVISDGRRRAGRMMPGFKNQMSEEQLWQLIAFIISLRDAPPFDPMVE